ncbi:TPA: hypothetical protein HA239_02480 [Candidatus Woesearchaeota archaeon]|nr:hypothetical protein QT06_C0001G1098 [archaeon GW2011_AR15]MBS3104431.1 hypothetical protein [Candidatus Woesearchaeota archaeon]HIH41256.1 hypothetical protein [Candidatus Woesearchaeota archaeon]
MEKIKYVCTSCNYDFSRKENIRFSKCPYCGKEGTVEVKKDNYASRLLNEVSDSG